MALMTIIIIWWLNDDSNYFIYDSDYFKYNSDDSDDFNDSNYSNDLCK